MNVSLADLRDRALDFRATDSPGETFNNRITQAFNLALDRLAGDVPEALLPDEEHVVLFQDIIGSDASVDARIRVTSDTRVLEFVTSATASLSTWTPSVDGTFDSIMHLEFTDPNGQKHRRQSLEFWEVAGAGPTGGAAYYVSIDRPWPDGLVVADLMDFRLYMKEFFFAEDVMEVLEPARIFDETRQQIYSIDTGGAYRQDMVDFSGEVKGRPFRMFRNRHFQLPAPRLKPTLLPTEGSEQGPPPKPWKGPERAGKFRICYTYVKGRKDEEWQDSPGDIRDPEFEAAPSPIRDVFDMTSQTAGGAVPGALIMTASNIDAMTDFDVAGTLRQGKSGYRIRFYVARDSVIAAGPGSSAFDRVEAAGVFYLLAEVEPSSLNPDGPATFIWDGSVTPDYFRPLKHSTGYYAYQVYPHQDARYELDFRVLRLPRKFKTDTDTAPIQRDAVPALVELALYYIALNDGADQNGAQAHLNRYQTLAQRFRARYANPGRVVEPVPLTGYSLRRRYGTFTSTG